jgi:hypothetical protein
MINSTGKQAFLIITTGLSKKAIKNYHTLKKAVADLGDVFFLYHSNENKIPGGLEEVKIETFTDEILHNLNYTPIQKTLVPGSNHFPVLQFYLKHPDYTYYWCLEDDVAFNGNWKDFFKNISDNHGYDFITSHIRRYSDKPRWFWWKSFSAPPGTIKKKELINSFNPIYRISNKALNYIDTCLKGGYSGHHEVLLPSLLKKAGFKIADFAAAENHVTPVLSYCTLRTMRWKPVFFMAGFRKNTIYHPVKENITFKQIIVYIKRTIYNQKEYFT